MSTAPALGDYVSGSESGGGIGNTFNFHLYNYGNNNPIRYMNPNGMWVNNEDGSFTAEEGDTLWGLEQQSGSDWHDTGFNRDPKTLQIGETVSFAKYDRRYPGVKTIHNNSEAIDHYYNGNGESVWISDEIFQAAKENQTHTDKLNNRIKNGATTLAEGDYGIKMNGLLFGSNSITDDKGYFFMGDTSVSYSLTSGTKYSVVDFTFFAGDGFWDIMGVKTDDGPGPNKEFLGGKPYAFYPRSYTVSFENPEKMGWKE